MNTQAIRVCLFCICALAGTSITAYAQQQTLRGRVVDASSRNRISFAHIENYSRQVTTFTDTSGHFTLQAVAGDTLVLSAIGYFYKKVIVSDALLVNDLVNTFDLTERIYELSEATIYIPGTYKEFQEDYLSLKLPETQTDVLRRDLTTLASIEGRKAYEEALAKGEIEPPKAGLPILTADEKARFKLKKVIGEEAKQQLILEKYNVEFVKQVTGLEEEDAVLSFMLFCDFDVDYLVEVNPLDLVEEIIKKYELYRKRNSG